MMHRVPCRKLPWLVAVLIAISRGLFVRGFQPPSGPSAKAPSLLVTSRARMKQFTTSLSSSSSSSSTLEPSSSLASSSSSPVETLATTEDLLTTLAATDHNKSHNTHQKKNQLVLVLYHAAYCKLCQLALIQYRKLAHQYYAQQQSSSEATTRNNSTDDTAPIHNKVDDQILFTRFETSHLTKRQLQALGVSRFPFLHLYRNNDLVASLPTGSKKMTQRVETVLDTCRRLTQNDEWEPYLQHNEREIVRNRQARAWLQVEPTLRPNNGNKEEALVQTWTTLRQFLDGVAGPPDQDEDTVQVVMFHSNLVPACHKAQYQFRRMAEKQSSHHQSLKDDDASDNKIAFAFARMDARILDDDLLLQLGVTRFPTIQLYRQGQCLGSFTTAQSYMFTRTVSDALATCRSRLQAESSQAWPEYSQENYAHINQVLEQVRSRQLLP